MKWFVESHLTGIQLIPFDSFKKMTAASAEKQPDLFIIDMDKWEQKDDSFERWLQSVRWIGISSERIFQTAYRDCVSGPKMSCFARSLRMN